TSYAYDDGFSHQWTSVQSIASANRLYCLVELGSLANKQVTIMASEQKGAIKPSSAQLDALGQYVRENMEVVLSAKSGKYYVTLNKSARNGQFGDLEGR